MIQLVTRWGKNLDREHVLKEYPRPGLVRDSYLNLNGEWDYYISNKKGDGVYDGKILVPFSPESMLSGVEKILQPDQYLHYRKKFHLPDGFVKNRVLIHFGGVDQECEIFINGMELNHFFKSKLCFKQQMKKTLKQAKLQIIQ